MPGIIDDLYNSVLDELGSHQRLDIQSLTNSYSKKRAIPHRLVRGLIGGLVASLTTPRKRSRVAKLHVDRLADCLLAWINRESRHAPTGRKRQTGPNSDEQERRLVHRVYKVVTSLYQHPSPLVLQLESNWLMQTLAEYGTLPKDVTTRRQWIEKKLRRDPKAHSSLGTYGLLGSLLRAGRCPRIDCELQTAMPTRRTLETWTHRAGSGVRELSFHILAYFHGSSYGTVKRRFRSRLS